ITRQAILDIARKAKLPVAEGLITLDEVYGAHECFLTGTAAELIPVVKVDGRAIGSGKPGPMTGQLLKAFKALTKKDGVRYAV
ncbi:MAG TPA: aminotransferase class IV, partial [Candidatus Omnitrophota bacterium]|nr:aminotransferase class IV [Candidatus Omnitrophota bacterium]